MQGPKGARRSKGEPEDAVYDFKDKINFSVFPSLQGGPHNHQARHCCRAWVRVLLLRALACTLLLGLRLTPW